MSKSLTEKLSELSKRRGFFFQSSEAYGGAAGFQTFGPEGAEIKRNVENSWRETFSQSLGHREIEAPTIMPEAVFEASGHLDTFDDMIIECPECGTSSRADHLVEDNTEIDEAEAFSNKKIEELIKEHNLVCPSCGEELTGVKVEDFNLMFETSIGPGSGQPGYLRPETAQGIFVEFPRLKEYARNQLPFGITQIGKAYRNEISPRKGLVRVRELTQAELEHFIDPDEDRPPIEDVEDVELKLYSRKEQDKEDGKAVKMTVKEAVDDEVVESDWIAYYLGIAKQWYESIGIDMERFRFRQHQNDELSHYASDCWDAESHVDGDWIEITGFAYRGCYDLKKHNQYSRDDYTIFKEYDEPKTVEKNTVSPDMGYLGPEFGDKAGKIKEKLEALAEEEPEAFEADKVLVEVDGEEYAVPSDKCNFSVEKVTENGEHILPQVVEPSFGIDRIVYTVLAHAFDEDEVDDEKRTVLHLSESVAPTEVAVFPLMDKEGLGEKARDVADMLRDQGFSVKYDDTGNIGKRYRRQDEVGTPVCVTVDYETLEEDPETVTVRDRDSTEQERVEISKLAEYL
ncbi:glycine--tRNA ligase [Candidatus Nanohalovita haloferacivicina]|uniref:glycine--tRNA ligase n=1 Tax=Candidatus Nanohalovita haloferacivicina TaxID=2978046 RepID=UPI00325FB20F|nr:Glycyl-tRNA synthetase [Candidatus Nanohalobia archaeon BNXNv]